MNLKDKKEKEKFKFVSIDELDEDTSNEEVKEENVVELETQVITADEVHDIEEVDDIPPVVEEDVNEIPVVEEDIPKEEVNDVSTFVDEKKEDNTTIKIKDNDSDDSKFHKIHFSFEARIITMIVVIIVMFGSSCFLIYNALKSGDVKAITYNEVSSSQYKVCLKDSNECLEQDLEYTADEVDKIRNVFKYQVDYSNKIDYKLGYHISAVTNIVDSNNNALYTNGEILLDKVDISDVKDSILIDRSININYDYFNKKVVEYFERNQAKDASASLELILYLDEAKEVRKISSLTIPLNTKSFKISKFDIHNDNKKVEIRQLSWNSYTITCAIIASILVLISILLIYKVSKLVLKVTNNRNEYQKKVTQILRDYDRNIVIARDGYESNVLKTIHEVEDFEELLDTKDNLGKPIIFSKVNDVKCEFIVEDDNDLYKYILKEADFL